MTLKFALTALIAALFVTSCVQKTHKKTVVFTLDTPNVKSIKKVGIRGNDTPLTWDYDTPMPKNKQNKSYKIILTFATAYAFTEVKFAVNDSLEFANKENRRVIFSKKDTTYYIAKFNSR